MENSTLRKGILSVLVWCALLVPVWAQQTWTARSSGTTNNFRDVVYGDGVFVAVGAGVTARSTDGVNWTVSLLADQSIELLAVAYGNNRFVAVGRNSQGVVIMESSSGTGFTLSSVSFATTPSARLLKVAFGNNQFVATDNQGFVYRSSPIWARQAFPYPGVSLDVVGFVGGRYIIYGDNGTTLLRYESFDAVNWQQFPTNGGLVFPNAILNESFVLVGRVISLFNAFVQTSADGINFSTPLTVPSAQFWDITEGAGTYVVVGSDGLLYTSTTLTGGWTSRSIGSGGLPTLYGVAYGGGRFVTVGSVGSVYTSAPPVSLVNLQVPTVGVCPNKAITVTANVSGLSAPYNFTLSISGGTSVTGVSNTLAFGQSINVGAATGVRTVSLTVGNIPGETASGTVNVTVSSLNVTLVALPGATIAEDQSLTLVAGGALSYTFSPNVPANSIAGGSAQFLATTTQTYSVTGTDGNGCTNSASVAVTVTPVNDAPVLTRPNTLTVQENGLLVFSNSQLIRVDDEDVGSGAMQMTMNSSQGTFSLATLNGLTFSAGDGTADAAMIFTGTLASINNALNGLTFRLTANYIGVASVSITVNDQGNTGSGGARSVSGGVVISVLATPPTITGPAIGNGTVCANGVATFTATIGTSSPQYSYTLTASTGGVVSGTGLSAVPFSASVSTGAVGPLSATLLVHDGRSVQPVQAIAFAMLQDPAFAAAPGQSATLVVAGQSVTLTYASVSGGCAFDPAGSYTVEIVPTGEGFVTPVSVSAVSSHATQLVFTIPSSLSASTNYSLRIRYGANVYSPVVQFQVLAPIRITASTMTICPGQSVRLTASACPTGEEVVWSTGARGVSFIDVVPTATSVYTASCVQAGTGQ
ncbi:hypothetical protein F5984_14625 [Rudanella paleaurantiibacter]|uniref:RapA2 cadherin-like domain-containing protein n=1 Tax=Rudanella paleaurantiibacter TaxID=2614655 RepID=A0A7J5TZ42_9BACT|nr:Ig-like domain-containing protein [Rudanella paleaurantiibacter]KAB7730383.1 hypothetical protein F5984_14625 [Rudanella paleaurantiibacter]